MPVDGVYVHMFWIGLSPNVPDISQMHVSCSHEEKHSLKRTERPSARFMSQPTTPSERVVLGGGLVDGWIGGLVGSASWVMAAHQRPQNKRRHFQFHASSSDSDSDSVSGSGSGNADWNGNSDLHRKEIKVSLVIWYSLELKNIYIFSYLGYLNSKSYKFKCSFWIFRIQL